MRRDKQKAIDLRKEGRSYRDIAKELKVSKGTLSAWFKGQEWSDQISKSNIEKEYSRAPEKMKRINMMRRVKFAFTYGVAEEEAVREFEVYKNEPLFNAGLMLYVGEGEKASKPALRIANTDFEVHKVFIQFLTRYFGIGRARVRIFLHLYPDLDEKICIDKWAKELNLNQSQFYKTQRIQGKDMKRKLQFGVGTTIISSTALKRKLFVWIKLAFEMYRK
ncbi:MAG: helix-turn-helix domain-containing protein [Candidatus Pacebacteria bacterium]|nr:helix-turn-helix domain-containing protein [Candidatus Paceibacterota bacterium]MBP9780767.1 helix-turn-helix domain-containing protein [Candidatus Paceibacterota bacterium]